MRQHLDPPTVYLAPLGPTNERYHLQAGGSEYYTRIEDAISLGGEMFGRKRKKQVEGQTCPLCQLVNPEDTPSCTRCYYEFTVAAHRQTVSDLSDEESGGLFDALLEDDDDELDDENPMVDWTSHSFSMDDMTVEVSPYDTDGVVEVDQKVSMEHQFDAPQQVARVKGEEPEEEEEYVLTSADAPKNVEKFDTGDGPDLAYQEEEYSAPVVKLVEMAESDDLEPVESASAIPDESDIESSPEPISHSNQISQQQPTTLETTAPPSIPDVPEVPITPAISPIPAVPVAPEVPVVPAVPVTPSAPVVPAVPVVPSAPVVPAVPPLPANFQSSAPPSIPEVPVPIPSSAPTPSPAGIWPWPQSDAWDDATVRKALREAMEFAKGGDIESSKRALVSLGPHLGDRVDLVFHIGVLLKKFDQEAVMRRMIETARSQHPDSPDVAKAVQHLLS